jgi:hypothetical protein
MSVRLIWAWYDAWIGVFIDKPKRTIYVFPPPMIGLRIQIRHVRPPGGEYR